MRSHIPLMLILSFVKHAYLSMIKILHINFVKRKKWLSSNATLILSTTPFSLLTPSWGNLLPTLKIAALQCVKLSECLYYTIILNVGYGFRNVHLTLVTNTEELDLIYTILCNDCLASQTSTIQLLWNSSNWIKVTYAHLLGMTPVCTGFFQYTELHCSISHHIKLKHRWCSGMSITA